MLSGNGPVDLGLNLEAAIDGMKLVNYFDGRIEHWMGILDTATASGNQEMINQATHKIEIMQIMREHVFGAPLDPPEDPEAPDPGGPR